MKRTHKDTINLIITAVGNVVLGLVVFGLFYFAIKN